MTHQWIKIDVDLLEKPEVFKIAKAADMSPAEVVGHLVSLWSWFDKHTENGILEGFSLDDLAEILAGRLPDMRSENDGENPARVTRYVTPRNARVTLRAFLDALQGVTWIVTRNGQTPRISIPKFDRHHSKSARSRALAAERQRRHRERNASRDRNADVTRDALPDKRREEQKKNPPTPLKRGQRVGFDVEAGKFTGVEQKDLDRWKKAYPGCDLELELRQAVEWLKSNPKRAPRSDYRRFITNWLKRQQDRGGTKGTGSSSKPRYPNSDPGNSYGR